MFSFILPSAAVSKIKFREIHSFSIYFSAVAHEFSHVIQRTADAVIDPMSLTFDCLVALFDEIC